MQWPSSAKPMYRADRLCVDVFIEVTYNLALFC